MKKQNGIQNAVNKALAEAGIKLRDEAVRFELLAKDLALNLCTNPEDENALAKEEKLKQHLLRAETFKSAASLIAPAN